jgi:hypothetical protein
LHFLLMEGGNNLNFWSPKNTPKRSTQSRVSRGDYKLLIISNGFISAPVSNIKGSYLLRLLGNGKSSEAEK